METGSGRESLKHTVGRSVIEVSYTDITQLAVDLIVSSDDVDISMGGGVSEAIRKAGGEEIFAEARTHRPAELGSVVVTAAGRLKARAVLHGIVLYYDKAGHPQTSPDYIRSVVRRSLEICAEQGARTIAFPALATGTAGLEPEQSAAAILVEIFSRLESLPDIDLIHLALDPRREVATRFYRQVKQYLTISEVVRRGERAIANAERFSPPSAASAVHPSLERLAGVRTELDAAMKTRDAADFEEHLAPQASEVVSAALEDFGNRVQTEIQKLGSDSSTTRLQVERLNALIDAAREERARLDREDIRAGHTTDDRAAKKAFLQERERGLVQELKELSSGSRPLVMSLHGIRTRGKWQKDINLPLNNAGFNHKVVDYGYFNLIRFLLPWARKKRVEALRDDYQNLGAQTVGDPSIIAHSLGSYIVTKAMETYDLRFDQVILCGSIVKDDYDWDGMIGRRFARRVLNDCGRQDIWARLAHYVVTDAGQSGLHGFQKTANGKVINRTHQEFGHSDYFYEKNYLDNWIPFLQGKMPQPLAKSEPARSKRRATRTLLIVAAAAAAAVAIYLATS